jgi:AcrR family transcriptional regulator
LSVAVKDEEVQQQILQAAKRLFQVHGLHKVTMDDVAKAVGKGRSSLYYYYKNRDEIFDAVVQIDIREMMAVIKTAVAAATTIEQKLNAFCVAKLNILQHRQSFYNTLDVGMDADALSNLNKMKLVHHKQLMTLEGEILVQILTYGTENGELNPIAKTDEDRLVFVLLSSLHGLKRETIFYNNFDQLEANAATLCRMLVHGLKN